MKKDTFHSVWDALADTPHEAESLKIRSQLMISLQERIVKRGLTQAKAAELLGVTQPRVSDLLRGKIERFSAEALVDMLAALGQEVVFSIRPAKRGHLRAGLAGVA